MKKLFYLFILSGLFLTGCTYNISKNESANEGVFFARMNDEIEDRDADISTRDSLFSAGNIRAGNDSLKGLVSLARHYTQYMEYLPSLHIAVSNDQIKTVSVVHRSGSIASGMALGAAAGGLLGLHFFPAAGGSSNSGQHVQYEISFIAGTIPGLLIGGILGAIVGDEYIFDYDNKALGPDPLKNNPARRFGIRTAYVTSFSTGYIETEGYPQGSTALKTTPLPGFSLTMYYNFPLSKMFSVSNELSFISEGDDQTYFLYRYDTYQALTGKSNEMMKVLELAPLIRMNLRRTQVIPYIFMGPKVDLLLSKNSAKSDFYREMNRLYGTSFYTTSGSYKNVIYGAAIGLGISTGRMLPWEISAELRYNFDISQRFIIDNHFARSHYYYNPEVYQNSSDWTFNLGFAFD